MGAMGRPLSLQGRFSVGAHREASSSPGNKLGSWETNVEGPVASIWLCEPRSLLLSGPQFPHLYRKPLAWIISSALVASVS